MLRYLLLLTLLVAAAKVVEAQSYFTRDGHVSFFLKTSVENINGENDQVLAIIDPMKKEVAFNLLVKGFLFEKQLMQDHFNEDVMQSDKYPKATFTGKILESLLPGKNHVHIQGKLTMHGITNPINTEADIDVTKEVLNAKAVLNIPFAAYSVKLPAVLRSQVTKSIAVTITVSCKPKQK